MEVTCVVPFRLKSSHTGSAKDETSYNIKDLRCLLLKVMFASPASFLYLDSSLEEQCERGNTSNCLESLDKNSQTWIYQLLQTLFTSIIIFRVLF